MKDRWDLNVSTYTYYHNYPPVISCDASSTCACGLFVLLVVVGIDVGILSLLLKDLSKLVFANAAEECAHIVGFLDHPLQIVTASLVSWSQSFHRALMHWHEVGEIVWTWLTWASFMEFCVAPPAWYSTLNFFTISSNLHTQRQTGNSHISYFQQTLFIKFVQH